MLELPPDLGSEVVFPAFASDDVLNAQQAVADDPNNTQKWDALLLLLEAKWDHTPTEDLKQLLEKLYVQLLLRFPYFTKYWKQYLVLQYRIGGLDELLKVLEMATREFPRSVLLWADLFGALSTKIELLIGDKKAELVLKTRMKYKAAQKLIGLAFLLDPFWNLYIDFEKKHAPENLLKIYARLITIPLYQYAQYYNGFSELAKEATLKEIAPEALPEYLAQYNKKEEELSELEQTQIVQDWSYHVFNKTQAKVGELWPFESALVADFSLAEQDPKPWELYIDHEIEGDKDTVVNLFERALVPLCFRGATWIKYVDYLETVGSFDEVKSVFDRAIFKFVPLNQPAIRERYMDFLLKNEKSEVCNEYLLDSIRLSLGPVYRKTPFVHDVKLLLKLWTLLYGNSGVEEHILRSFFENRKHAKLETEKVKPELIAALSKFLNCDAICVVAIHHLESMTPEDARRFYNEHHTHATFKHSVQFWKFFVDLEKDHLVNLKRVLDYIVTSTSLPKKAIDALFELCYEYVTARLRQAYILETQGHNVLDIVRSKDALTSNLIITNGPARQRLSRNNHAIKDFKDDFLLMAKSQTGHPGIFDQDLVQVQGDFQPLETLMLRRPGVQ